MSHGLGYSNLAKSRGTCELPAHRSSDNDRHGYPLPRRLDHHRQPLDPRRPADGRRVRAAEAFDQAVIAAAGDHRALRAQAVGDEFEGGVAVIIEAADEARVARPGDAGGVEAGGHLREEIGGLGA